MYRQPDRALLDAIAASGYDEIPWMDDTDGPSSVVHRRMAEMRQNEGFEPGGIRCLHQNVNLLKGCVAMAKKSKMVPTSEFSKLSGISVTTLNKWIREKKIKGQKQSGRWMIGEDQLKSKAVREFVGSKPAKVAAGGKKKSAKQAKKLVDAAQKPVKTPKPKSPPRQSPARAKTYSVDEFSAMTFLTESGVRQFLKLGRLKGEIDAGGNWQISAENLLDPLIKHLVR